MMSFREYYDRLIEMLATEDKATVIMHAKIEFWRATGKMHGDEPSFESRMAAFFDWYLFDKKVNGMTPLEEYLAEEPEEIEIEREIYREFLNDIHSIFIVKKITSNAIKVRDLFTRLDYSLNTEDGSTGFYRGAVFEGRVLPYSGGLYLSPALCFHPKESRRIIKHLFKMVRKAEETEILPLIHRLSHMNLKWETYRNIKVRDIYKFEEYGERRWWHF
ncbi:MAG: hypothetical protein HY786_01410 [Deltaproteobacteria bacterium]|nr:hypothetical protein [Deltaproteobacteria bacterium]